MPGELEEAAQVDGATPTQIFRHILLPQLAGVIALIAVLRFIWTFNAFDEIYLLTGGGAGTEVLATQVYTLLTPAATSAPRRRSRCSWPPCWPCCSCST